MAHLFTNRHRQYNRLSRRLLGKKHFGWEATNAILYLIGGLTFILGSVFFLPRYESLSNWGALLFFGGSLIYAFVTVHDWLESHNNLRSRGQFTLWNGLGFLSANLYLGGTLLFALGSLLLLQELDSAAAGGWCFIIGSSLFFLGASINVMEIIEAGSILMFQLSNATALAFSLGSSLFFGASIPLLWKGGICREMLAYIAWQYIIGSAFFFLGGLFNYYRAYRAQRHHVVARRRWDIGSR